jgi:hypothetical protein
MNAESFEKRTVFKIPTPAQIERVGRAFDLRMSPDFGRGCMMQLQPNDLAGRGSTAVYSRAARLIRPKN